MRDLTAVQAEELFIGSLLHNPEKLLDVEVTEKHFVNQNLRLAFKAVQRMELENEVIDVVSLAQKLEAETGRNWLAMLGNCQSVSFAQSFFKTSQMVMVEDFKKREVKRITEDLNKSFNTDKAIQELMGIDSVEQKYKHSMAEAAMQAIEKAQETAKNNGVTGLTTGLQKLDDTIGGFQSPDLYIMGARPAMGKTSVILNLMLNHKAPVGFFSTEQPSEQIGLRAISAESSVSARKIRTANFDETDMNSMSAAVMRLASSQIQIYDKGCLHITELMREARRMKFNQKIEAVYVDYIQRIKSDNKERRLEVAEVVTSLKSLARELEIPVIGLAQVNRKVEDKNDKRPHMGDLLESGVIEQEADVVMLLYRDEVYHPENGEKGVIEILIDKNRHGPTGKMKFAWLGDTMQIKDLAMSY